MTVPEIMSSQLGTYLQTYLKAAGMKQQEIAAQFGIAKSHLSRILSGQRKWLDMETIVRMVTGISEDRQERAMLLKAYLLDQCPETEETKDLIEIIIKGSNNTPLLLEDSPATAKPADHIDDLETVLRDGHASPKLTHILGELFEAARACPDLARVLEDLTKLEIRAKKARTKKSDKYPQGEE